MRPVGLTLIENKKTKAQAPSAIDTTPQFFSENDALY
ncbi:hypothetical protein NTG1052_230005 [Candidatus Nitrotoga sp. 1052]|nr:hypothetical protein NTG1052_230005 [Candidatus Nitrotoga sp. 1052]